MDILHNFPVSNAILITAIQADRIPICDVLSDAKEKSIICSLLFRANSKNLRAPITISRKTLGIESRQGKTALYENLKSLKQKGILEDNIGTKWIRFTEQALALMSLSSNKPKEAKPNKAFYRLGDSFFPVEAQYWANKDLGEQQIRALMKACKTVKTTIQNVLAHYKSILENYTGGSLFAISLDIIKHPDKYQVKAPLYGKNTEQSPTLTRHQKQTLLTVQHHQDKLLAPGEKIVLEDKVWMLYGHQQKQIINNQMVEDWETRMKQLAQDWFKQHQAQLSLNRGDHCWNGQVSHDQTHAVVIERSGKIVAWPWSAIYGHLPENAQIWQPHLSTTPPNQGQPFLHKIGHRFRVKGTHYLLETIQNGMAYLQYLSGQSNGRMAIKSISLLNDQAIQWDV